MSDAPSLAAPLGIVNLPGPAAIFTYYIKGGNKSCYFVGNSKLKLFDYDIEFNTKAFSAVIESSVRPVVVVKSLKHSTITFSTSVKKKFQEQSIKYV